MLSKAVSSTTILLLLIILATVASAENILEINFDKYEATGGVFRYDIFMEANKDGATTCELVTPTGTYSFIDMGGMFRPNQQFIDDHVDLDFAGLTNAISGDWELTWDALDPDSTIATISFGSVPENDFMPVPILSAPIDGDTLLIPGDPNPPNVEWNYGATPPCEEDPDFVEVLLTDLAGTEYSSDELSCLTTSWMPPSPLIVGIWFFQVQNTIAYRDVPDGIDIEVGTWTLENADWLDLRSIDTAQIVVKNVENPAKSTTFGAIKALYRE